MQESARECKRMQENARECKGRKNEGKMKSNCFLNEVQMFLRKKTVLRYGTGNTLVFFVNLYSPHTPSSPRTPISFLPGPKNASLDFKEFPYYPILQISAPTQRIPTLVITIQRGFE